MLTPFGAVTARHDPEDPVAPAYPYPYPWTGMCAQHHGDLLPLEEVLQYQRTVTTEHGVQETSNEREYIEHGVMIANRGAYHLSAVADGVFASSRRFGQ